MKFLYNSNPRGDFLSKITWIIQIWENIGIRVIFKPIKQSMGKNWEH